MTGILIVGGDSLIGRALFKRLKLIGVPVRYTSRKEKDKGPDRIYLDLASPVQIGYVPDTVYVCAGVTGLGQCEMDPGGTRIINVDSTISLIESLHSKGSYIIYLSSHAVFDGSQPMLSVDSATNPVIEYGKQKAEVERRVLALGQRVSVIRMTKVVSCQIPLIARWHTALRRGEAIHPFKDMVLSPISLDFLVSMLTTNQYRGIIHVSSEDQLSYAEFASRLAKAFGFPACLVQPILTKDSDAVLFFKPRFTSLDMTKTIECYGIRPPSISSVVADLVCEAHS